MLIDRGHWECKHWMKLFLKSYGIVLFIAVSLGLEIVNCLLFHAICVHLHPDFNTHAFGHCINSLGKNVTAPKSKGSQKVDSREIDHCWRHFNSFLYNLAYTLCEEKASWKITNWFQTFKGLMWNLENKSMFGRLGISKEKLAVKYCKISRW